MSSQRIGRRMLAWMVGSFLSVAASAQQQAPLLAAQPQTPSLQTLQHDPLSPFTADDVRVFFAAVAEAEKISDPLQRCLHFPDPPGSHWSRTALDAYCRYRLQSMIGFEELKQLVNSGHASEVDRRFAEWAKDPASHPEFFWRFLNVNFFAWHPGARDVLESWKQQMPQSAFAHAASGYSFVRTAWGVRGGASAQDTPQARFDGMENVLARADGDLRLAVKLAPQMGAAYTAMMNMGMLDGDVQLMQWATKEGMAQDPGSYPIFDMLSLITTPKWHGSPEAQAKLLEVLDKRTTAHPLLVVVRTSVLAQQADVALCQCRQPQEREAFRTVFDQVGTGSVLTGAGKNALDNGYYELAAVYLAEALRFDPNDVSTRSDLERAVAGIDPAVLAH